MPKKEAQECFWLKPTLARAITAPTPSIKQVFPDLEVAFSKQPKKKKKKTRTSGRTSDTIGDRQRCPPTTPFVVQALVGTPLSAQLPMLVAKLVKLHGSVGSLFRALETYDPSNISEEVAFVGPA